MTDSPPVVNSPAIEKVVAVRDEHASAAQIQALFRGNKARAAYKLGSLSTAEETDALNLDFIPAEIEVAHTAAAKVQARFRGNRARAGVLELLADQAATTIQAVWRGKLARSGDRKPRSTSYDLTKMSQEELLAHADRIRAEQRAKKMAELKRMAEEHKVWQKELDAFKDDEAGRNAMIAELKSQTDALTLKMKTMSADEREKTLKDLPEADRTAWRKYKYFESIMLEVELQATLKSLGPEQRTKFITDLMTKQAVLRKRMSELPKDEQEKFLAGLDESELKQIRMCRILEIMFREQQQRMQQAQQAQQQAGMPGAAQGKMVQIKIPDNWTEGKNLVVNLGGQQLRLTPPPGSKPGQVLNVQLRAPGQMPKGVDQFGRPMPGAAGPTAAGAGAGDQAAKMAQLQRMLAQQQQQQQQKAAGGLSTIPEEPAPEERPATKEEKKKARRKKRRARKDRNAAHSSLAMDLAIIGSFAAVAAVGYFALRKAFGSSK
jgi:hypothetical protein